MLVINRQSFDKQNICTVVSGFPFKYPVCEINGEWPVFIFSILLWFSRAWFLSQNHRANESMYAWLIDESTNERPDHVLWKIFWPIAFETLCLSQEIIHHQQFKCFIGVKNEEVNVVTERKVDIMWHKEIKLLDELCNNREFNTISERLRYLINVYSSYF